MLLFVRWIGLGAGAGCPRAPRLGLSVARQRTRANG